MSEELKAIIEQARNKRTLSMPEHVFIHKNTLRIEDPDLNLDIEIPMLEIFAKIYNAIN